MKDIISSHIFQALRRAKVSLFYLENGMIEEASKEAQKSWRYFISSVLILNLYRKGEEVIRYYTVPKSKIFSISKSLEDKGYKGLIELSSIYFVLTNDVPKSEAKILIPILIRGELEKIREWFKDRWSESFENELTIVLNELKKEFVD